MLVHIKEIVKKAEKGNYGVGAFNTANLEITLGIARAAKAKRAGVIIQVSEKTIEYAGLKDIVQIVKTVADSEAKGIPIALHLDHGHSLKTVKACVKAGFSSVHMDASSEPFEKNIALTKKAVEFAHRHGAWAQGELGSLIGQEGMTKIKLPKNPDEYMTNPDKAAEFVARTGVDTLAISVGAMHGLFKGKEKLDLKRLTEIHKNVKIPLVLHGASGVPNAQIKAAIKRGVRIINIDTTLRVAFTDALRATLKKASKTIHDPRKILSPSIGAVEKAVAEKIAVFKS